MPAFRRTLVASLALALAAAAAPARAVPSGVPYSATLTHADDGTPHAGAVDLRFALFGQAEAGDELWGPCLHAGVALGAGGRLDVVLGGAGEGCAPLDPEALADLAAVWLEVEVRPAGESGWVKLEPRQELLSAPFALAAANALGLGGAPAADYLTAAEAYEDFVQPEVLAAVATSGKYVDLVEAPELGG